MYQIEDVSAIFNCNNISMFAKHIVSVLNYSGASMSKFYICETEEARFLVKLSFYKKLSPELTQSKKNVNVVPPVAAEIHILRLLNQHINDANLSPCVLRMVTHKTCSVTGILNSHTGNAEGIEKGLIELLQSYKQYIDDGAAHDKCSFIILEKCDVSFDDLIKRMYGSAIEIALFKSLLFQIIYTMKIIKDIYPGFRHNDLHTENVMLKFNFKYKYKPNKPAYIRYDTFYVPYFGITPKIIDFGYSAIPEVGIVSAITEDKQQMQWRCDNDLIILFYWINVAVSKSDVDISGAVLDILTILEPNGAFVDYDAANIKKINSKLPTYADMVYNEIFSEYRKPVDNSVIYRSYNGTKL